MAVVVANAAADPVALFNYFHSYNLASAPKTPIPGGVRITLPDNQSVDFIGNFTFHPYLPILPIGGTLTTVKVMKGGALQFSVTGLNLDVQTVYSFTSPIPGAGQELGLMPIALAGNDTGTGSNFADKLPGFAGHDRISGRGGNDTLDGMTGNDTLKGDDGNDTISGGLGNDTLNGGADTDIVSGDAGSDTVQGGTGNDTLNGGLGNDRLIGGTGNDKFVFNTTIPAKGVNTINGDRIADFNLGNDTIQIDNAIFKGLALGALKAANFKLGAKATDADDRVIYNRATGDFFFDANGSGGPSTDQVKFAHLDKAAGAALFPAVGVADLFVI